MSTEESHGNCHKMSQSVARCCKISSIVVTIGPSRIITTIPQEFSGVTEVRFIMPIDSLRWFWCTDGVIFTKRDKTRWCNFSWKVRLLNPQKIFGVIGSVIITLICELKHSKFGG